MNIFTTILIEPLANGLILFYNILFSNMGLAIIAFSLFLRLILNPLTKPYMKSMKKMKDYGPELEKLKAKHKGDKVKLAQAQSDFYKQKGINPGAGCIPYILQIVVLIAFFRVFTMTLSVDDPTAGFNELLYEPLKFEQGEVVNTQFLIWDLTKPDVIRIPGIPIPLPGILLILAATVQLLSSKIMAPAAKKQGKAAKKTKGSGDDFQVAMQQSMVYTFPLFTIIFGMSFPAGLALYWLMFSLWQGVQQYNTYGLGGLKPWVDKVGFIKSKN